MKGAMLRQRAIRFLAAFSAVFFLALPVKAVPAGPETEVGAKERCPVCGMFVAKYPAWLSQIRLAGGGVKFFDGVKDMMAYYHAPKAFGGSGEAVAGMWVRDYYSLEWLEAEKASYVLGSDVHGPMGHEFIPFASRAAAENFLKDHKGTRILRFDEISARLVDSLRSGQKMR